MCNLQIFYNDLKAAILNFRLDLCCFVFSVKAGILLCGYFNVISNMICLIAVSTEVFPPLMMNAQQTYMDGEYIKSTCAFAYSADLCLAVLLLCARYRKDIVLLTYYMYCGLAMLASTILVYSMVIGVLTVLHTCTLVISLTYQIYIILLVRSMMVDLKHEAERFEYFYQNYPVYFKHDIEAGDYPLETYEKYDPSSRKSSEIVPPVKTLPKTTTKEVEDAKGSNTKEVITIIEPKKTSNSEEQKPSEDKVANELKLSKTVDDIQPATITAMKEDKSKTEAVVEAAEKPKALRYPYKFIAIKVPKEESIKEENENEQKETEKVDVKEKLKVVVTGEETKEVVISEKDKDAEKEKETKEVAKGEETEESDKKVKKQKRSIFGRKKRKDDEIKKISEKKN